MRVTERVTFVMLALLVGMLPVFAQDASNTVVVRYTSVSPFLALLAGILILIVPRLLNYVVAVYLILIGLIGILVH